MIYEPRKQHVMKLRLSKYIRRVLLGPITDDIHVWYAELMRRIKIDWRGAHTIRLDYSVFSAVRRIGGQRVIVKFLAVDEENIEVVLLHPFLGAKFSAPLRKRDVIRLLLFESPAAKVERQRGAAVTNPVVHGILQDMKLKLSVSSQEVSPSTHPALFEKPFDYYLTDREKLSLLADQLAGVLSLVDKQNVAAGFQSKRYPLKIQIALDESARDTAPAVLDTSLRTNSWFAPVPRSGEYEDLMRTRRQFPVLDMEEALNAMAYEKAQQASSRALVIMQTAAQVQEALQALPDPIAVRAAAEEAAREVADDMLGAIHHGVMTRFAERNEPGQHQALHEVEMQEAAALRREAEEREQARLAAITEEDRAILVEKWVDSWEGGAKVHYREGKVRWNGHVSVKVARAPLWLEEDGMGRRYKFTVYEPNSAQYFEGIVRSRKHLREILGLSGQDLIDPAREKEMLMFVTKYRMDVVVNKLTWDGEVVEEGAPPYRIEFQSDRLYNADKVTPINAAEEEDEEANRGKLQSVGTSCFFCLFIYLFVYLFVYLFGNVLVYLFIGLLAYLLIVVRIYGLCFTQSPCFFPLIL
jgi:hypothetical protein